LLVAQHQPLATRAVQVDTAEPVSLSSL
jgi:hypothetical protein